MSTYARYAPATPRATALWVRLGRHRRGPGVREGQGAICLCPLPQAHQLGPLDIVTANTFSSVRSWPCPLGRNMILPAIHFQGE